MRSNSLPLDTTIQPRLKVRRQGGFTLLELLVVLFIIGIIVSFAGLSVGQHSSRTLQDEAERLQNLVRLAGEEAVLQGRELALEMTRKDYRFLSVESGEWLPIEDDTLLRERELPPNLDVELQLEGVKADFGDVENPPRIFILSSSEMTPFILTLSTSEGEAYILEGDFTGKLTLTRRAEG